MKSDAARLMLVRPDPRRHAEAIYDLTGKTFGNYWDWLADCRKRYFGDGFYDWSASTIGILNGEVVTHWGIWGYDMRIGRSNVRVAGVGGVATHAEMRKRGLMTRTGLAAVEASRQARYDMSVLFGRWDFYDRFGYVASWPWQTYVVSIDRLPKGPAGVKLRKFATESEADIVRLYNCYSAGLTGSAVRPTYVEPRKTWQRFMWHKGRTPAGYVIIGRSGTNFELADHAGDAECVLRVVAQLARQRGIKEAKFVALHYHTALARLLRRGYCKVELQYVKSGGAMVRTLELASTLKKISPELSARLKASEMCDWRGKLLIADKREKVALKIGRAKVVAAPAAGRFKHAVRGGEEIAQLLIGTEQPREVAEAGRMRLAGDAGKLIEALFPIQYPMLAAPDMF